MEQRVQDLIEQLQSFDGNTRIEGCVNLKWNDKRTALVATEQNMELENEELNELCFEQHVRVRKLESRIAELEAKLLS